MTSWVLFLCKAATPDVLCRIRIQNPYTFFSLIGTPLRTNYPGGAVKILTASVGLLFTRARTLIGDSWLTSKVVCLGLMRLPTIIIANDFALQETCRSPHLSILSWLLSLRMNHLPCDMSVAVDSTMMPSGSNTGAEGLQMYGLPYLQSALRHY